MIDLDGLVRWIYDGLQKNIFVFVFVEYYYSRYLQKIIILYLCRKSIQIFVRKLISANLIFEISSDISFKVFSDTCLDYLYNLQRVYYQNLNLKDVFQGFVLILVNQDLFVFQKYFEFFLSKKSFFYFLDLSDLNELFQYWSLDCLNFEYEISNFFSHNL